MSKPRTILKDASSGRFASLEDEASSPETTYRQAIPAPPVDAEGLARRFHEAYERLAPDYGYETRDASRVPWEDVPANNRALMVAVCEEILDSLGGVPGDGAGGA